MGFQQQVNTALITAGVAAKAAESTEAGKLTASLKATETLDNQAKENATKELETKRTESEAATEGLEKANKAVEDYLKPDPETGKPGDKRKKEYKQLQNDVKNRISAANSALEAEQKAQEALDNIVKLQKSHTSMFSRIQQQIAASKGILGKISATRAANKELIDTRSKESTTYEKLGVKEGKGAK